MHAACQVYDGNKAQGTDPGVEEGGSNLEEDQQQILYSYTTGQHSNIGIEVMH